MVRNLRDTPQDILKFAVKIDSLNKKNCLSHTFSLPLHPYSTCFLSILRVESPCVEVVIR